MKSWCRSFFYVVRVTAVLMFGAVFLGQLSAQTAPTQASQAQTSQSWMVIGPDGGDVRSITGVPGAPQHLYIGTTNSWIYESLNGGASWQRLSKVDAADDLILDHIIVDPDHKKTIYVGGWKLDHTGGGFWISHDGGLKWTSVEALKGQSVRSLAQAPSDPGRIYVGTLEGVYRSNDYGRSWALVSPHGNTEIHEVQSLAVDPVNPAIVYAGTWHLPWKTIDGGITWNSIKQGVIDDSDVFSIIVDPNQPSTLYISACSGIYKSDSAGDLFRKIQGIPATARRTRALMQDPVNHDTVYAGTTEGLYKTVDGGKTFQRQTQADVIVNGIFVNPADPKRILIATDRGGVLASKDAGVTFQPSNKGFSQRKVESLVVGHFSPHFLLAGVANDKANGGVFYSPNYGDNWRHIADGLNSLDVFVLAESADGTVFAGTSRGIYSLAAHTLDTTPVWKPANVIRDPSSKPTPPPPAPVTRAVGKRTVVHDKPVPSVPTRELNSRVYALSVSGPVWLAATEEGLFTSRDHGASWQGGPVAGNTNYKSIAVRGNTLAAANDKALFLSTDGGVNWSPISLPAVLTGIRKIVFSSNGTLWLGAREGVFFSTTQGQSWLALSRLPFNGVDDVYYDLAMNRVLIGSHDSQQVYVIDPEKLAWQAWDTGYNVNLVRTLGDHLLAASMFDGVLLGPKYDAVAPSQK